MPATRFVRMVMASLVLLMSPHLGAAPALPEPAAGQPVALADLEPQLAAADHAAKDRDLETAAGILTQALAHDPDGRVRERLVAVRFRLGQTQQALRLALDAAPPLGVPHALAIATHLARDDHWQPALDRVERQLAAHPQDARLAYLRGVLLHHTQPHTAAATQQFLAVLDLHTEIPNAPAPNSAPADDLLPPGAATIDRQARAQKRALSVLSFPQPRPNHDQPFIHLPAHLADAHDLAIAWLRFRAVELDTPALQTLITQLEARGHPLAGFLLNEPPIGDRRPQLTPEVFAQYPAHPDLLGAAVTHGLWEHDGLKREQLTVAAAQFADERPGLALDALLQLRTLDITQDDRASAARRWEQIAPLLEHLDAVSYKVLRPLTTFLSPSTQDGAEPHAHQRRAVVRTLERTYPGPQPQADWITQHESTLLAVYAQDGRWNDFAQLLTDITRAAPATDAAPRSAHPRSLPYPPRHLPSLPRKLNFLVKKEVNALNRPAIDHAAVLQALPPDAPPVLRALAAAAANDGDHLQALCAATPPTDIAPRMIHAAWLTRHGVNVERQPAKAADTLAPLASPHTDGPLVAYATESLRLKKPLSPATLAAARQAVQRLRTAPFHQPQFDRWHLAESLDTLGLPEAAAALLAESEALPATDVSQRRRRQSSHNHSPRIDRIQRLLANQQRHEAIAVAAVAIRSLSQYLVQGATYTNQPAPNLIRLIHTAGLADEVIAHLSPPAASAEPQRLAFAGALELLSQTDAAVAAYQRCLDARPTASAAARLAILLLDRGDLAAAADALTALPPVEQSKLRSPFVHQLNHQHHDDPRRVIAPALMAAHWIENVSDSAAHRASWVTNLFGPLARTRSLTGADGLHLHHAAARKRLAQPDPSHPVDLTLYRERLTAHDRLARAALRVPALAKQAANLLVLSAQLDGRPLAQPIDTLERAIRAPRFNTQPIDTWAYAAHNPGIVRLRPPLENLAAYAARHAQAQRIQTTADTLRSQNRTGEADHLAKLYALYAAPPQDLPRVAESFVHDAAESQTYRFRSPLIPVIDAWSAHPASPPDLGPLILRRLPAVDPKTKRQRLNDLDPVLAYARAVHRRHGLKAAEAWIQQFSTAYFGSDEARDALVAEARPNANNDASRRVDLFVGLMNRAALDPHLMWVALDHLEAVRPSGGQTKYQQRNDPANVTALFNALERATLTAANPTHYLTQVLAHSPLLGSAQTFRSGRRPGGRTFITRQRPGRSVIDALRHHIATHDTPFSRLLRDDIATWIDQQPPTLGAAVTGAALRNLSLAETLERLTPYQSEITRLTPPQRQELLAALPKIPTALPDLSPIASAIARELRASPQASAAARAQRLLKPTFRWNEQRSYHDHSALVFELLAEDDIPTADRLMAMWGRNAQGQWERHFGYSEGQSNDDLWRSLRARRTSATPPAPPAACLRLVTTLSTNANFSMPGNRGPGSFVNDQFARLRKAVTQNTAPESPPTPDTTDAPDTFFAVLAQLQPALGDDPTAALLLGLAKLAEQTHPDAGALRVSASRLDEHPSSDLHRTARAALDLAQARRHKAHDGTSAPKLHRLDAYVSSTTHNDTLSRSVRLGLLSNVLAAVDPQALPKACAAAAQQLHEQLPPGWGYSHFGLAEPEVDRTLAPLIRAAFTLPPGPYDASIIKAYIDWATRDTWSQTSSPTSIDLPRSGQAGSASRHLGSPGPALRVLNRALQTQQLPEALRLLKAQERRLATSPAAWMLLARHGHAGLAASFIRQHHTAAQPALVTVGGYDADAAHAVLEELNATPDLRFFAQAALAVLAGPDIAATTPPTSPHPARRARLVALAQRFSAQTFSTPELRRATLVMLTRDDAATALLREPLEAATQHLTLASTYFNYSDKAGRELCYATLVAGLRNHHLARLHTEIDRVFPASGSTALKGSRHDDIRRDLLQLIRNHLSADHGLGLDQLAELAPTFQRLMTAPPLAPHRRHGKSNLRTLWIFTLLDRHAAPHAFEHWYASRPESEHRPGSRPDHDDLRPQLKTLLLQPNISAQRRRAVLSSFIASAPLDQHAHLLQALVAEDALLSQKEANQIASKHSHVPTDGPSGPTQ